MKIHKIIYFLALNLFALVNLSVASAQTNQQTATVTLVSSLKSNVSIFDYSTDGYATFLNEPDKLMPNEQVDININLYANSSASVKFRESSIKDCVYNPENLKGLCGEIKFVYDSNSGAPGVELDDNLRKANNCTMGSDYENHHSYVICKLSNS